MSNVLQALHARITALEAQIAIEKENLEKFGAHAEALFAMPADEARTFLRWIYPHVSAAAKSEAAIAATPATSEEASEQQVEIPAYVMPAPVPVAPPVLTHAVDPLAM